VKTGRKETAWIVDVRIILKLILKKYGMSSLTGFTWLRTGTSGCMYGKRPSCFTKGGEFLD
jgi:hypothetical protein